MVEWLKQVEAKLPDWIQNPVKKILHGSAPDMSPVRLSCDLGTSKVAFLEVARSEQDFVIQKFVKVQREAGKELGAFLQEVTTQNPFATNKVRISVKGQGVVVRFIQFPMMSDEELKGAIVFEAEKYIPFKSDEVILDYQILDREVETNNGKMMNLLLVAVKRDEIYPLIANYQNAGLQVELIDSDAFSFLNTIEHLYPQDLVKTVGILDFGNEISTLGVARGGQPLFIRDVSFGGQDLMKRIKRKSGFSLQDFFAKVAASEIQTQELEVIFQDCLMALIGELKVSLDYYQEQVPNAKPLEKLFVSGEIGSQPIMVSTLSKGLRGLEVVKVDVINRVKIADGVNLEELKHNESILPVALGLCIREL